MPGDLEQVLAFGVVEVEGAGHAVQDAAVGGTREIASLQSQVVVDRHTGQHRGLFTAQPR
ncbi:hypothetical protein [Streptomyces sp. IBSBF 3136]|uniref:hypothetical protein n=1 Tax=Streptomyces sp. IBSBF 3136 TaxID=2903524 RepID=UPI002FDC48CA